MIDPEYLAYQDVLYESLAGTTRGLADADPATLLRRLAVEARTVVPGHAFLTPLLQELLDVGTSNTLDDTIDAARMRFPTPAALGEAILSARSVVRDAERALQLIDTRVYLQEAVVPQAYADLGADRQSVLQTLTVDAYWRQPERLEALLPVARIWQQEYFRTYVSAHGQYHAALAPAVEQLESAGPSAAALRRLNGIRRLGPPLAVAALQAAGELDRLFPCLPSPASLATSLAETPFCRECGYQLGQSPPTAEIRRTIVAIERGLASQQVRLARRVTGLVMARPSATGEERIQRFLEVVQASDVAALTLILDEELAAFLDTLL